MYQVHSILTPTSNYIHVLECSHSYTITLIDPGHEIIFEYLQSHSLKPDYILLTHSHADHTNMVPFLVSTYNSKIIAPYQDVHFFTHHVAQNNDLLHIGLGQIQVFHVPGHTQEHVMYYIEQDQLAFTGDTLFHLGCGKALYSMELLYKSLQTLKRFPKSTVFYPGHEYGLTNALFAKQLSNEPEPALLDDITYMQQGGRHERSSLQFNLMYNPFLTTKNFEDFQDLRLKKDTFNPDLVDQPLNETTV